MFVAGSSPREIRQSRSTFDAPLASAISANLDYSGQSPPVIPMLPNGGRPGSFKAAIPIRNVAAGLSGSMGEGIGRLRREMKKVRSPRLTPQSDNRKPGPVPLEFEEDDQVFLNEDEHDGGVHEHENEIEQDDDSSHSAITSRGDSGASLSTPSTNNNAPLPDTEPEEGFSLDDMDGLDEEETFDEISAVGLMDEEQVRVPPPSSNNTRQKRGPMEGRKGR